VTRETVYNYISFLSGSFFFHFVSRFSKNTDKEVSSGKKIYICDNGLANQLIKLSEGQLLENAVYLNLRKYGQVKYYQDKNQREIDFVLPESNASFEVKRNAILSDCLRLDKISKSLDILHSKVISYTYIDEPDIVSACLI